MSASSAAGSGGGGGGSQFKGKKPHNGVNNAQQDGNEHKACAKLVGLFAGVTYQDTCWNKNLWPKKKNFNTYKAAEAQQDPAVMETGAIGYIPNWAISLSRRNKHLSFL